MLIGFAYFKFKATTEEVMNPFTGEMQRLSLTPPQEVAPELQSVGPMSAQHGGEHPDPQAQDFVDRVGEKTGDQLAHHGKPYASPFEFHLLLDDKSVNAFALPGGQI